MKKHEEEQEREYCKQAWQKFWDDEELTFEDFLMQERAKLKKRYLKKVKGRKN